MIVHIPEVLGAAEVARFRERLDGAEWADGKVTAGYQSALAKRNLQLPERGETALALNEALGQALARSPALPGRRAARGDLSGDVQPL